MTKVQQVHAEAAEVLAAIVAAMPQTNSREAALARRLEGAAAALRTVAGLRPGGHFRPSKRRV